MAIFRKDGNENKVQRRDDQTALQRPQPRGGGELTRDPFELMARDPWQLMREMMIDPFRMFRQWNQGRDVALDPTFEMRETDDAFVLKGDLPGVRQDDVDISLIGNNLQITGKRDCEVENEEGTWHTYERSYGSFSRSFTLPETADLEKVRCDLKDGVLTLVAPKRPGTAPHRRKIQIGGGSKA